MSKLRILHLEDNANDAFLVQLALERSGFDSDLVLALREDDFVAALEQKPFDVILLDDGLPGFNGAAALAMARERCPRVPVIFVSGAAEEKQIAANLKAGATDHVPKGQLSQLVAAIRRIETEKLRVKDEAGPK